VLRLVRVLVAAALAESPGGAAVLFERLPLTLPRGASAGSAPGADGCAGGGRRRARAARPTIRWSVRFM